MSRSLREIAAQAARRARGGAQPLALARTVPDSLLDLGRLGAAPRRERGPEPGTALHVAIVIPPFRRGGGGHRTIVHIAKGLAARGHRVSVWLEDFEGLHAIDPGITTRRTFGEFFDASDLDLHLDFRGWRGADVVVATGWQTVPRALLLEDVAGRAYLVQDHEPDFYAASAEALLAAATYRMGLHCIAASPWLAGLLRERYGTSVSHFDLGVDHAVYRPTGVARRDDLVVFYARAETPRRAVPLGLLALAELARRRPRVEIALFGSALLLPAPFPHSALGTLPAAELADLYCGAALGMAFSLTNPSLVELEMLACGLPCVELDTAPVRETFGAEVPIVRADPGPEAICTTLEGLLEDRPRRMRLSEAGPPAMRTRGWDAAATQVEDGLWTALGVR